MLVSLAQGQGSVVINKRTGHFSIQPGEVKDCPAHLAVPMLDDGIFIKSGFPMLLNNQVGVYDGADDSVAPLTDFLRKMPKTKIVHDEKGTASA